MMTTAQVRQLCYRGVNSYGVSIIARTQSTPSNLTKALFGRGMRWVTVTDAETGEVVGEVTKHPDTGKRTWWAAG